MATNAKLLSRPPDDIDEMPVNSSLVAKNIPAELWNPIKDDLKAYLRDELQRCEGERRPILENIERWKEAYDAPIPDEPKHFPIHNSSNLTVPVIKEILNTLVAQLVQSTLTARPHWVTKDLAAEWEPLKDEIEQFMDLAAERDIQLDKAAIPWIIEGAKFGTSIMEMGYQVDQRNAYRYTSGGDEVYKVRKIFRDGPRLMNVPLKEFYIREHETDANEARWCAKGIWFSKRDLLSRVSMGKFSQSAVDKVLPHDEATTDLYHVLEVYVSWDIDGDNHFEELRLYYHPDSETFLSYQFNPYWHAKRPFIKMEYFPRENSFYGEGLCEMLEGIQEGISADHNRRADNATMANLKMFVKRKMVKGLMPGDPLYTGKIIDVNDIHNDIKEMQMAEVYPSTAMEEQIKRGYADRLSGINEAVTGSAMPVSRTTASAQLALLQEQAKRIDLTVRSIREGLNEVGWYAVNLYFQYGVNGKGIAWFGERGKIIEAMFRLPRRVTELGMALKVQTPTSIQNRQVRRESAIAMFNLLTQMYGEILPLAQHLAPESLPEVVRGMVTSAQTFMGDVLESFEVSDPEEVLAGLTVLEKVLPRAEDMGGLQDFERGAENAQILEKLTGLGDLLREAEATRDRREGLPDSGRNGNGNAPPEGISRGSRSSLLFGG